MLKAYSVYDREAGPAEGALLVFAENAREARRLAWPAASDMFCCEYIDMIAKPMPDHTEMLAVQNAFDLTGPAAVFDSPVACQGCDQWGHELNEDQLCETCHEDNVE